MWHCCARHPHFKKCNKSSIYFFILKQTVRKKLRKIVSIFVFLKILPSGHFHHDPWIFFQSKIPISFSTPLDRVGNVRKAGWRLFWQKKKEKKLSLMVLTLDERISLTLNCKFVPFQTIARLHNSNHSSINFKFTLLHHQHTIVISFLFLLFRRSGWEWDFARQFFGGNSLQFR